MAGAHREARLRASGVSTVLLSVPLLLAAAAFVLTGCQMTDSLLSSLPIEDDFEGSCDWPEEDDAAASADCHEGEYRLVLKRAQTQSSVLLFGETGALSVQAAARLADPAAAAGDDAFRAYGVGCWAGDVGYVFAVSSGGDWAILEIRGGRAPQPLRQGPGPGDARDAGRTVSVRGDCALRGRSVALGMSVNGRRLSVVHGRAPSGRFDSAGFYADSSEGGAEVRFDDFRAAELDPSELPGLARDRRAGEARSLRVLDESVFQVAVEDPFADEGSGWPVETSAWATLGYAGGAYGVRLNGRTHRGVLWDVGEVPAVVVEAEAQGSPRPGEAYGLACYTDDGRTGYVFAVSGDGRYGIYALRPGKTAGDPLAALVKREADPESLPKRARLHAECVAGGGPVELVLVVDGRLWARAEHDPGVDSLALAGVYVSGQEEGAHVRFDDVVVRIFGEPPKAPGARVVKGRERRAAPPVPPPPPVSPVVFRGQASKLEVEEPGFTARAGLGVFRVWVRGTEALVAEPLAREVVSVGIEADATDQTSPRSSRTEHGLACAQRGERGRVRAAYVFSLNAVTATYRLERLAGPVSTELAAGTARDLIERPFRAHRIRIECRGGPRATRITARVNGRKLVDRRDRAGDRLRRFDSLAFRAFAPGDALLKYERVSATDLAFR